jgi:hypothetical protein
VSRLATLKQLAGNKGKGSNTARWFSEYDSSVRALQERHCRMLLSDLVLIMQNASPYNPPLDFHDNMADVMSKSGQSMMAASHVLRDDRLFQVSEPAFNITPFGFGLHPLLIHAMVYHLLKPQSAPQSKVAGAHGPLFEGPVPRKLWNAE